jgi:ribonuclease HII
MAVIVPTLRWERPLWRDGATRVAGVDEVGVAPTCGAVVAAAVILPPNCHRIPGVRDSKTLSAAQRERLAPIIRRRALAVGVGAASVADIDRLNIYHATHLAMRRAIARLGGHDHVLVDGLRIAGFEAQVGPYTAIVDGDARVYTIACASVIAKVVRDRMMQRLAVRYPEYGWEHNAGYATSEHRAAIRAHGLTPHHRRSWQALQVLLAGDQLGLFDAETATGVPVDGDAAGPLLDALGLDMLAPDAMDVADTHAEDAFATTG